MRGPGEHGFGLGLVLLFGFGCGPATEFVERPHGSADARSVLVLYQVGDTWTREAFDADSDWTVEVSADRFVLIRYGATLEELLAMLENAEDSSACPLLGSQEVLGLTTTGERQWTELTMNNDLRDLVMPSWRDACAWCMSFRETWREIPAESDGGNEEPQASAELRPGVDVLAFEHDTQSRLLLIEGEALIEVDGCEGHRLNDLVALGNGRFFGAGSGSRTAVLFEIDEEARRCTEHVLPDPPFEIEPTLQRTLVVSSTSPLSLWAHSSWGELFELVDETWTRHLQLSVRTDVFGRDEPRTQDGGLAFDPEGRLLVSVGDEEYWERTADGFEARLGPGLHSLLTELPGIGPVIGTWAGTLHRYRESAFEPWLQLSSAGIKGVTRWRDGLVLSLNNGEIFIYAPNVEGEACADPAAELTGSGNASLRNVRAVGPDHDRILITDALQPLRSIPSQLLWLDAQ